MQNFSYSGSDAKGLRGDLALINGPFVGYLEERYSAAKTISIYRRALSRVARSLSNSGRQLSSLQRRDVPAVMRTLHLQGPRPTQTALHGWLKFQGRFHLPQPRTKWRSWLDEYVHFMEADRGLSPSAQYHYRRAADRYMAWQFRRGAVDWQRVRAQNIWRYAAKLLSQKRKVGGVCDELSALRQFLRFMHLRGSCSAALPQAVPAVADRPQSVCRATLTEKQRQQLLASFDRRCAEGSRNHTMALCMTDLGLRCIEVSRLCLGDIDLELKTMMVPAAKNSRGRQLPLPPHVAAALRSYVRSRPATNTDRLFVGHTELRGKPLSSEAVRNAMVRAYRRCGFHWCGTHRLRRCFATRLYARGANLKEIADLLGHRFVTTTERYAQVDPTGLRAVVCPWPI